MSRQYTKYDEHKLREVVAESASYTEVARRFGKSPVGGTLNHIRLMCERYGIDVSHMTGQGHNKDKKSSKRLPPDQRLVKGSPTDHRIAAHKLRAALLELGVEHKCNVCGIDEWCGKKLVLEIDHIDECYWNNQRENLQFLCPNCHAQKNK